MVGQIVGNYRLLRELSRGGMGAVYRAEHELLGKAAAIKFLRPELSANEDLVKRFFDEARAASAIRHPGIVEVYDFGYTAEGDAYYVMELLEGETLGARLAKRGKLDTFEAAAIARDIAGALSAAHDAGIVHRDLKPDNIFLVPSESGERVKVVDFGVAKLSDRASEVGHTQTGVLMGTPLYMAPEQARAAAKIDHRADLYSLGCILYEMLAGVPPFTGEGAGEIIAMQLFTPPPALRTKVPAVPDELDDLVMRMLAKEPGQRPASASAVHRSLADLRERPTSIAPTPMPSSAASLRLGALEAPAPTEKRGSLGMVAAMATVLLASAIVMIVLLGERGTEKRPAPSPPPNTTSPSAMPPPPPQGSAAAPSPPAPVPAIEPARAAEIRRPTRPITRPEPTPREIGPVVRPDGRREGTIKPPAPPPPARGPVTDKGSPIETSLDDPPPAPKLP